ncbi:transcriptional regulator PaaX [Saccharolobus solfataricus]|uniref:Transcriptional regulator PaaX n=1 Tax=Saccharolobus solfataricus TaxID=2287 RepID=A0A7S9IGY8_SACSO|nr:PaaX family transcriptional regulator C-terminal domain-containing protein [Saccharolobus solfataricus]QPG48979.1 transcriptional regulator PaaX [Saccharolobus solfataricus]
MKIQSLFFTLYGDYIKDAGGTISSKSLIIILKEFGFSEGAIRAGLHRMKKAGLIVSERGKDKKIRYKLSEKGLLRLLERTRRVYEKTRRRWDGKWRIVVYNIPENNREVRDRLRRELKWLGFGMLAQSTWISPNPIEDTLRKFINDLYNSTNSVKVDIFVADYLDQPNHLVERCWNLVEVEQAYKSFLEEWSPMLKKVNSMKSNEAFVTRIELVHEYRKFLNIDPDLPEDLLPQNWIGYKAYDLFMKLREELTPKANEFFYKVYEP